MASHCARMYRLRMTWMAAAAGGLLALSLAGCDFSSRTSEGPAVVPQPATPVQHPLLKNFPLPAGFRIVPERSVAKEAGPLRIARCEFEGHARPEEVVRFYEKYMPTAGFEFKERRYLESEYELRFESASETCTLRIRPQRSKSVLWVDLGPHPSRFPAGG